MPTSFPGALDTFNNPSGTSALNAALVLHSEQHANLNDAVAAMQAKIGITNDPDPATLDYQARHAVSATISAENKEGSTIAAGMACAVHSSGTGVIKACAADGTKIAVGLIQTTTLATISGEVQTDGLFTLADWTAIIGSATLGARTTYFLDQVTPGRLTATPPTTPGQVLQIVGTAVSADTLDLCFETPVLL